MGHEKVDKFNKLLLDISKGLEKEKFALLKYICQDHVDVADLEKCEKDPVPILRLFHKLADKGTINKYNVCWLKKVLLLLDKVSLKKQVEEYEKEVNKEFFREIVPIRELLYNISKELTNEDLVTLKTFCNKIGRAVLEKIDTALELFIKLEQLEYFCVEGPHYEPSTVNLAWFKNHLKLLDHLKLIEQIEQFEAKYGTTKSEAGSAAPLEQHTAQQHPAQQCPAQQHPAQQCPAQQHPAQQHPANQHPAHQYPAPQRQNQQHPAQQCPAQKHPAHQYPASQLQNQQHPAQQLQGPNLGPNPDLDYPTGICYPCTESPELDVKNTAQSSATPDVTPQSPGGVTPRSSQIPGDVTPRSSQIPGDVTPRSSQNPVDVSPRSSQSPGDVTPRSSQNPVDVSPRSNQSPRDVTPRSSQNPGGVTPRSSQNPGDVTPRSSQNPGDVTPRSNQNPVDVTPSSSQNPVDVTRSSSQSTVDSSPSPFTQLPPGASPFRGQSPLSTSPQLPNNASDLTPRSSQNSSNVPAFEELMSQGSSMDSSLGPTATCKVKPVQSTLDLRGVRPFQTTANQPRKAVDPMSEQTTPKQLFSTEHTMATSTSLEKSMKPLKPQQNVEKSMEPLKPQQNVEKSMELLKPQQAVEKSMEQLKPQQNVSRRYQTGESMEAMKPHQTVNRQYKTGESMEAMKPQQTVSRQYQTGTSTEATKPSITTEPVSSQKETEKTGGSLASAIQTDAGRTSQHTSGDTRTYINLPSAMAKQEHVEQRYVSSSGHQNTDEKDLVDMPPTGDTSDFKYSLPLRGPDTDNYGKIQTDAPSMSLIVESIPIAPHFINADVRPKKPGTLPVKQKQESLYDALKAGKQLPLNRTRTKLLIEGNFKTENVQGEPDNNLRILEKLRLEEERLGRLQMIKEKLKQPPKSVKLYGYQHELAKPALSGLNCILCAPTGSGKTFTAGYICYTKWKEAQDQGKKYQALFVVCIRNLILQQKNALQQVFPEQYRWIIAGMTDTITLQDLLQKFDIVVLTAQILVNCIQQREVFLEDFQLLIMDECHHTNLGHPYNVIMQQYHKLKNMKRESVRVPQIVGLTASLGVGDNKDDAVKHYIRMCANLDCTLITHVHNPKNWNELLHHNPRPQRDQIVSVPSRDPNDIFILIITHMMKEVENLTSHLSQLKPSRGTQQYENWMVEMRSMAEKRAIDDGIYSCQTLLVLNNSLLFYDDLRAREVLPLLEMHFRDRANEPTVKRQQVYNLYDEQAEELDGIATLEQIQENPKLEKLINLLVDLYTSNPQSKGLLLAKTRFTVDGLVLFVKNQSQLKGLVKCTKFVGQGRTEGAMTNTEQDLVLALFKLDSSKEDQLNLLVATDVAQEGLDMPLCNFVIRYNFVSNEIGSVQSRGRARAKNSECYLIVNKGSINESREYENLEKEHSMNEAMNDIDEMDPEELERKISEEQTKLWKEKEIQEQRKAATANLYDAANVGIYCKGCKQFLAKATDMRKRGSNFIVCDPEFENRVETRIKTKPLAFRYDSHIGYTFCKEQSCNKQLGPKVEYQKGSRRHGFVVSKDAAMWKIFDQSDYRQIKQWSKVPFAIEEEAVAE